MLEPGRSISDYGFPLDIRCRIPWESTQEIVIRAPLELMSIDLLRMDNLDALLKSTSWNLMVRVSLRFSYGFLMCCELLLQTLENEENLQGNQESRHSGTSSSTLLYESFIISFCCDRVDLGATCGLPKHQWAWNWKFSQLFLSTVF